MLDRYHCQNAMEYEQALKEIIQETAMSGLARSGFFKEAAFTGARPYAFFTDFHDFPKILISACFLRTLNLSCQNSCLL